MSDRYNILLTRSMLPGDIDYIRKGLLANVGDCFDIVQPDAYDEASICDKAAAADVLLGPYITQRILRSATKASLIQIPWTGVETFDFSALKGYDIPVCNSHSNADSVAELGVALLLDLLKKVSYHDKKMRLGSWNREQQPLSLKSRMIKGSTVCILGCGSIGYRMAKTLKAFGARIVAVDEKRLPDEVVDAVYPQESLFAALECADIVICALPLTDKTRGVICDSAVYRFMDGAYVVNMSRAEIFTEDAVYNALSSGKFAGYAADIWWTAPKRGESESYLSTKYEFQKFDNIVLSPHRAGYIEGSLPHLDDAIENITNLINRMPLINIVNRDTQY